MGASLGLHDAQRGCDTLSSFLPCISCCLLLPLQSYLQQAYDNQRSTAAACVQANTDIMGVSGTWCLS